jgi:hypothetical protein
MLMAEGLTTMTLEIFTSQHFLQPESAAYGESRNFQALPQPDKVTAETIGCFDF